MAIKKLHDDEHDIDIDLAKDLVSGQFPEFSGLELTPIELQGTDNIVLRLGDDKMIRLPRRQSSAEGLEQEIHALKAIDGGLPIYIPKIIGIGQRAYNYPFPWLICSRLEGKNINPAEGGFDQNNTATLLGGFISSMQKVAPTSADPKCTRGPNLKDKDEQTRPAIELCADTFDAQHMEKIWDNALKATPNNIEPVWSHGDLHPGNVLFKDGKLSGVVDFGMAGLGDPAIDLMVAWTLLDKKGRETFKKTVNADEQTWTRAKGWALTFGVVAFAYYQGKNEKLTTIATRTIEEVLSDF